MRPFLARVFRESPTARGASFLLAALAIGTLVGAAAALLVVGISYLERFTDWFADWSMLERAAFFLLVPAGILLAWLTARIVDPAISGDGVPETMAALSIRGGYLPTRWVPGKILATILTLGLGGSAGREGPIVQIGATVGSSFARYTRFGEDQIRSLIAAGAGAGIGASFNAPIAGMLFAMEVILGNFAIRHLNAVVVASVAAAVTTRELVGEERILSAPPHSLGSPSELVLYGLLGLLVTVAVVAFLRSIDAVERLRERARLPRWAYPIGAGIVVALLGLLKPEVLGTGQEFVGETLSSTVASAEVWWILGLLALLKIIATSVTIASGGSGGAFMPSLFVGAMLGAGFAQLMEPVWQGRELSPGAFAVVGMAATFAAMARAPLTSIIIVFEITGDYGLVLPLMLASSLAVFLADRLHPESVYTMPLRRRGIHLVTAEDIDLLDTITVGEVMSMTLNPLRTSQTLAEAAETLDRERHHGLPVVDEDEELIGVLTLTDIAEAGGPSADVTVEDAMTPNPITVTPSMPVSAALARMAALGVGRLPVVADEDPRRLVGMFRRESVVHAYHKALGATTDRHLYRQRLKQRTQPGTGFFEMPVPPGSAAAGKLIRDVPWPREATLVSVRRGSSVLIPHGDTILRPGDTITAFGTPDARVELAYVLEPTADTIEMPAVTEPDA